MRRFVLSSICFVALAGEARAIVGPSVEGGPLAAHAAMVLKRGAAGAGFCSAVVLAPDVLLTAGHCVAAAADTRGHYRDASGKPVVVGVTRVAVHPLYRANAPKTRERSIDLALVKLSEPLPGVFAPATLSASGATRVGDVFTLAGYGLAGDDATTSGVFRTTTLAARAPLSSILLWAHDPAGRGAGACTGDSGGPIFDTSGAVFAVTNWSAGDGGKRCGALTQGAILAPQRKWIEDTLRAFGR